MNDFIEHAQFYAKYHQKKETLLTHCIGIPLVLFSLLVLLGFVEINIPGIVSINMAWIGMLAALVYYFRMQWELALILTPVLFVLTWLSRWFGYPNAFGVWTFIICFAVGWAFQLYGHHLEKNRPALLDNFKQALIAPLFLVAELMFMAGFMKDLHAKIHNTYGSSDVV